MAPRPLRTLGPWERSCRWWHLRYVWAGIPVPCCHYSAWPWIAIWFCFKTTPGRWARHTTQFAFGTVQFHQHVIVQGPQLSAAGIPRELPNTCSQILRYDISGNYSHDFHYPKPVYSSFECVVLCYIKNTLEKIASSLCYFRGIFFGFFCCFFLCFLGRDQT